MSGLWLTLWLAQATAGPLPSASISAPVAPPQLTLEAVLADLEGRHPQFAIAAAKLEGAAGKQRAARGGWDPVFSTKSDWVLEGYYPYRVIDVSLHQATPLWGASVGAGFRHSQGSLPIYKGYLQTQDGGEIYAQLKVPLLRGGAIDGRRANIRLADRGADVARCEQADVSLRLRRDAAWAYWAWAAAASQARVEDELLTLAQTRQAQIAAMVEQGELPDIERIDNQRAILQRRERLQAAGRRARAAAIKLSLFWRTSEGLPRVAEAASAPAQLPSPPAELGLDVDQDIAAALEKRPDLRGLIRRQAAAATQVSLADNNILPKLDFLAGIAHELHHSDKEKAALEIGARLSLPLALREGRGKAQAARAEAGRLALERRYLQDRLVTEVQDVHSQLATTAARWQIIFEEVAVAHAVETAERSRLREGESSILVVNLREQARADAAKKLIEVAADFWSAWGTYQSVLAVDAP